MSVSQNGYSANDRSLIASFTVPGTKRKLALRKGDTSVILLHFAAQFHAHVQPIDIGGLDDWAYAERNIRGSSTVLSNHASGTAMDLNASLHPLAKRGTFSAAQVAEIHALLKQYHGVVRWGGDYQGRCDEMHFEINAGAAACRVIADQIRKGTFGKAAVPAKKPPVKKPVAHPPYPGHDLHVGATDKTSVRVWQQKMAARGVKITVDGDFGPASANVAAKFRQDHNILPAVGVVDKRTWDATWTAK